MARRPRLSDPVTNALDDIKNHYDCNDDDDAIRYALREAGYDV